MNIITIPVEDTRDYAARTDLPAPMLAFRVASTDRDTLEALAKSPAIDEDTVWDLAFVGRHDAVDNFWSVRWLIARRADLPVAVADEMLLDPRMEIRVAAAENSRVAEGRVRITEGVRTGELVAA